jgi:LmbE family N-acetylglucosaminyl deacetylase
MAARRWSILAMMGLGAALSAIGCGGPSPCARCGASASKAAAGKRGEGLDALARAALAAGCESAVTTPPVPSIGEAHGTAAERDDVVVYTAHPDDEAMYAGGTMAAVVRGGHRVAVVIMSHGEGGRLLELGPDGAVIERRDLPLADVATLRDRELARAASRVGVRFAHVYPADARVDYGWTTSCSEALAHWDRTLPGGVRGVLERLVADMRRRRPRVVITLDPRDDPQASHHGHHRAVGVLVELAARAAADRSIGEGPPHVVEELLTFAPKDAPFDVSLDVGSEARLAMLAEYPSQFREFDDLARRTTEHFVVRWRARGARAPELLSELAAR